MLQAITLAKSASTQVLRAAWQPQCQPSMLHASAEKTKVLHKPLQLAQAMP